MQSTDELMDLVQLVRGTAAALVPAMTERLDGNPAAVPDAQVLSEVQVELGVAFQALARVARRLDLKV